MLDYNVRLEEEESDTCEDLPGIEDDEPWEISEEEDEDSDDRPASSRDC